MEKSIFDIRPELVVEEGSVTRINFDIEEIQEDIRHVDEGEPTERTFYKAYVVRIAQPLTLDSIKNKIIAEGFSEFKATDIAAEVMLYVVGDDSEQALPLAKQMVIARISQYDSSSAVNEFTFGGKQMWLDDATRTKLSKRFDTDEQDGKTDTKLIYEGVSYSLPIQQARAMLHQIESYARDCFDKTNEHKAAVMALGSIDAVQEYNYTVGYPTKLNFDTMFSE